MAILWHILKGILLLIAVGSGLAGLLVFTMVLAPLFSSRGTSKKTGKGPINPYV